MMSRIFTVNEVSGILQLHYNTVYELVKTGKIKSFKIGRSIRIPECSVEQFINEQVS